MSSLLPWLGIAGIGALHGLNPATGWALAAAWGVRSRDRTQVLRALMPIAAGHVASVAIAGAAMASGLSTDRFMLQVLAGVLLAVVAAYHLLRRKAGCLPTPAAHAGLALSSFMMSTAHGAGLMLAPALIPLCMGNAPVRGTVASGPLTLALAAVGIHTAAMLAVTGVMASVGCRGFVAVARLLQSLRRKLSSD
ncbi:hypothetical protein [Herbaspirillum sp. RV1423]|uniref:hypothetical protein n=1 Tax=Herbaspirillum sp. RV1423 TaxID=1443993 RepID=UPI0004AF517B|nr:hypothetical protein [Herbaspirillum sp. RV1423]